MKISNSRWFIHYFIFYCSFMKPLTNKINILPNEKSPRECLKTNRNTRRWHECHTVNVAWNWFLPAYFVNSVGSMWHCCSIDLIYFHLQSVSKAIYLICVAVCVSWCGLPRLMLISIWFLCILLLLWYSLSINYIYTISICWYFLLV